MDENTKKLIGTILILLGVAAIGVIAWDFLNYYFDYQEQLTKYNNRVEATKHRLWWSFNVSPNWDWTWTQGEIFQIIAGFISIGAGISIRRK